MELSRKITTEWDFFSD